MTAFRIAPATHIRATLSIVIAAVFALGSFATEATETVEVLGQQVRFSNPPGYCTLGKSSRELSLLQRQRLALGNSTRLEHSAAPCSELQAFVNGRREYLDHWLQIQLIGPNGNFRRLEMSREEFLTKVSQATPRIDHAEIERRMQHAFESSDVSLSQPQIEPLGRDGNAIYFHLRMMMTTGSVRRSVSGISATTLLNSLPLAINAYEATGLPESRDAMKGLHRQLLTSLLTQN